ncbi:response regulator [uncultured Thermanaerothrix sp.]|uniref:response regulator n=1 Tax=uncultured Thermanaerothrix sp. TaxID=1195149 RepID=UPI00260D4B8C|nr:response regulator [uncultured Thermanaerothrix sp.]
MAEKILVVDDDLETLRLVGLMLQKQGYHVITAASGEEGLQVAVRERPDLILLDIMMPGLDGFEVTRKLRQNPETSSIPILIFTAKSQVEDKIEGYEAGADDYLTKPIHPAELIAHIKALLGRSRARREASLPRGYVLGLIAAKGGIGLSTLALNLGLACYQRSKSEVILAELRLGEGTWAEALSLHDDQGLKNLLSLSSSEVTRSAVENNLLRTTFGVRLLLAPRGIESYNPLFSGMAEKLINITRHLATLATLVILDIGTPFLPGYLDLLNQCDEVMVVAESQPFTLKLTRRLLTDLEGHGFGKSKLLTVVLNNRMRADLQYTITQVQDTLEHSVSITIPPVPELAYHAAMRSVPLLHIQPEGLYAQQVMQLASQFVERTRV